MKPGVCSNGGALSNVTCGHPSLVIEFSRTGRHVHGFMSNNASIRESTPKVMRLL